MADPVNSSDEARRALFGELVGHTSGNEARRLLDEFAAAVRAEAVADERRRVDKLVVRYIASSSFVGSPQYHVEALLRIIREKAAGSVPVATPEPVCANCGHSRSLHHQYRDENHRYSCLVNMCDCPLYGVATPPAEPAPSQPVTCEHGKTEGHGYTGHINGRRGRHWCPGPVPEPKEG